MNMNKEFINNKWMLIVIPLVGITISLVYFLAKIAPLEHQAYYYILHSIVFTAGLWIGCLFIVTFLWKKYPWEHHPVKHLIIEVIALLLYTNLFSLGIFSLEKSLLMFNESDLLHENIVMGAFITNLITFFITTLHEAVFFYKQWKYNFSKSARLEKDNIEAKYETLKSQINPHFLFNSLNSLTTLVDDNNEAVDYIQNLSEFLRYVLKSRDRELVLVRDEVLMLQKYMSLQKSRFRNNLVVSLQIPENYYHYSLPPLVLQMLFENCIKHNIISKDKPLEIAVFVENEAIVVRNNLQKKQEVAGTGQGLNNIVARFGFFTDRGVKISNNSGAYFTVEIPLLTVEL